MPFLPHDFDSFFQRADRANDRTTDIFKKNLNKVSEQRLVVDNKYAHARRDLDPVRKP
jgi:hypothetical protein